jgi:hypothetical protein
MHSQLSSWQLFASTPDYDPIHENIVTDEALANTIMRQVVASTRNKTLSHITTFIQGTARSGYRVDQGSVIKFLGDSLSEAVAVYNSL